MQALFTQPVKKLMITNNSPGEMSYLIASMEQISKEFPLERSVTPTDLAVVRPLMSLEWGQITSVYPNLQIPFCSRSSTKNVKRAFEQSWLRLIAVECISLADSVTR